MTIHPTMAYVNASTKSGPPTNKVGLVFITDNMKHDSDAVAVFTKLAHNHIKNEFHVTHIDRFTDCCAGQYRSKKSFEDLLHEKLEY